MSEVFKGYEVKSTSIIYAELILEGYCTFNNVARYFKADTALVLVLMGAEELVTDEKYLQQAKDKIAKHDSENE